MIHYKLPSHFIALTIATVAGLTSYAAAAIVDVDTSSPHPPSDISATSNGKSKRSEFLAVLKGSAATKGVTTFLKPKRNRKTKEYTRKLQVQSPAATNSFWHALPMTESPVVEKEVKDIIWDIQMSTPNEETYIATSSFNWHGPSLLESPSKLEEVKDEDVVNGAVEMEETEYLQEKDPCEEEPIRALRSGGRISKKSRVSHVFEVPCHIVIRLSFFHKIICVNYIHFFTLSPCIIVSVFQE